MNRQRPSLALRAQMGIVLLFAWMASPACAQLDPDMKKPYQIEVVLQIASNRVFTPLFQEQVQRDVQNQLKISFGALARIEVTRTHPLLRDIDTKGLDTALESWDALSDRTTHFVLVDYVAGAYQIRTRSHDGMTGQPAPRTQRTTINDPQRTTINDRVTVAATIAHMVEAAFSPVGTVTAVGKDVTLKLKGGDLGVNMDRWVQPGRLFAVSRIVERGGRRRGERLEWAVLEVIELQALGACRCQYHRRYQQDALGASPGTLGYRAVRLPTVKGLIKVQLLDDTTLQPLDGVRVRVQSTGAGKPAVLQTDPNGMVDTRDPVTKLPLVFTHLALVEVLSGETIRAQFPVEVIEGRIAVARVKIETDRESLVPLEVRRDAWFRRVYENVGMSSERAAELAGQLNQSLEAALALGRKSLPLLEEEIMYLDSEYDKLIRLAKEKKLAYDLRDGQQQIAELRTQAKEMKAFVDRIDGVLKEADGSEKTLGLHKLLERARLLEAEAEFEPALKLYDQIVQASPDQAKIKAHRDQLKAGWTTQGEKHVEARKFIYEIWPTLDIAGLQKNREQANGALGVCRDAGDKLTPQKLLRVNITHTANLKKQLETLKRRDTEDNRNQAKAIVQISEGLLRLHNEAATYLGSRKD